MVDNYSRAIDRGTYNREVTSAILASEKDLEFMRSALGFDRDSFSGMIDDPGIRDGILRSDMLVERLYPKLTADNPRNQAPRDLADISLELLVLPAVLRSLRYHYIDDVQLADYLTAVFVMNWDTNALTDLRQVAGGPLIDDTELRGQADSMQVDYTPDAAMQIKIAEYPYLARVGNSSLALEGIFHSRSEQDDGFGIERSPRFDEKVGLYVFTDFKPGKLSGFYAEIGARAFRRIVDMEGEMMVQLYPTLFHVFEKLAVDFAHVALALQGATTNYLTAEEFGRRRSLGDRIDAGEITRRESQSWKG